MLAVLQGYICATKLLLGDTAEGKLALLQDLADGDEVRCDLRNREREGRHSWMRCWPFYIRAFPGGDEKVCVSSEQGGMMTGMPQRLCQLCWTSSGLGHHRRAQTWGCKPPCQMLKSGPTAKPGRPSRHTVPARWAAGHFAGTAVQARGRWGMYLWDTRGDGALRGQHRET